MARPVQDSVVLLGDSLTSRQEVPGNLHARFSEVYRRTLDVLNRGLGAYNSKVSLELFDEFFARKSEAKGLSKVKLVTIWYGTNDAVLPGTTTGQHVPLEEYTSNLQTFLVNLTSPTSDYPTVPNIILITPPVFFPGMMTEFDFASQRKIEVTDKYRRACLDVGKEWRAKGEKGKEWRVGVIDLWGAIVDDAGGMGEELRPYFNDGLHLTSKGYDVLWKEITRVVNVEFAGRGVDWDDLAGLPFTIPDWATIDHSVPGSAKKGMTGGYSRE